MAATHSSPQLTPDYNCGICNKTASLPASAVPCSHTFCSKCFVEYRRASHLVDIPCPTCSLTVRFFFPNDLAASVFLNSATEPVRSELADREGKDREFLANVSDAFKTINLKICSCTDEYILAPTTPLKPQRDRRRRKSRLTSPKKSSKDQQMVRFSRCPSQSPPSSNESSSSRTSFESEDSVWPAEDQLDPGSRLHVMATRASSQTLLHSIMKRSFQRLYPQSHF